MFNMCYECDGSLQNEIGSVYGYWGDVKIEFVNLPRHKCSNCGEFYLEEYIAILTQEITRALNDIDYKVKIVDVSDSYKELINHLDEIYEEIVNGRIKLIHVNDKIIINSKDVNSLLLYIKLIRY